MIKGEKVYLRPILKTDLNKLNEWKNDENVYQYLGGGFLPTSIDQHENWLDSLIDTTGTNKRFIISDYKNNPIGMVGLYSIHWIHRSCEIGLYIGEKTAQGRGYAKEAGMILEKYAKEYLNIRKIKLNVVLSNEQATQLWKKMGYLEVGIYKEERFIRGEYKDLAIMEKFL